MQFQNIYTLFRSQTAKYGNTSVFFTRSGNGWESQTWLEFEDKVNDLACAFLAKGLTKGASVAILAGNIPEWSICDLAAIAALSLIHICGIQQVQTTSKSTYDSLQISLSKRFSNGLQFLAAYTKGESIDFYSGAALNEVTNMAGDQVNWQLNRGPSDFNRTDRFVLSGVYACLLYTSRCV